MISTLKARRLRVFAVLATVSAATLLGAFQAAPSHPTLADALPTSPIVAPPIRLPAAVLDAASIYIAYVDRAASINPAFTDGPSVQNSLRSAEAYESKQMQKGITAYAAIVALQEPSFVAAVRKFGQDPTQRRQVTDALVADPRYAIAFDGADKAAGLAEAALTGQAQRILDTGAKMKQEAYDMQHQKWSTATVVDRDARLALAKSLSETPLTPDADAETRMQLASNGTTPLIVSGSADAGPYTPTVTRALAVAAMAALGSGGEEFSDQLNALLEEPDASECLHEAKLNLYECLAVAKPHYEDVFCLGQHVLNDTGQCIIRGAVPHVAPKLTPVADVKPAPAKKGVSHKKKRKAKS